MGRGGLGLLVQTGVRKPRGPRTTATSSKLQWTSTRCLMKREGQNKRSLRMGLSLSRNVEPVSQWTTTIHLTLSRTCLFTQARSIFVESFSWTSITPSYTGPTAVHRLIHIANHSPTLAPAALQSAIQTILQTSNTSLYSNTVQDYNALISTRDAIPIDQSWIEEVLARNATEKNRLEVELKQYTSNMIKESIRVSPLISYPSQEICKSTMIDGASRFGRLLPLHR